MSSKIKSLFSQTSLFSIGGLSIKLISFLMLPLYLAYLTPADYGVVEIVNILISVLTIVLGFGISSAVFREYYREDNEEYQKGIIGTAFVFLLAVDIILVLILLLLRSFLAPVLLGVDGQNYVYTLVVFNTFFAVLLGINFAVIRAKEKPLYFTFFNIIRTIVYAVVNIYLIVKLNRGYIGVCEGIAFSTFVTFLISSPILFKNMKLTISTEVLTNILKFGLPLIVSGLSLWILNLTDRYMLKYLLPETIALTQVGIYSLAAKFSSIAKFIIIQPFSLSWGVAMYKHEKEDDAKTFYANTFKYFVLIEAVFYVVTVILAQPVIQMMTKNVSYLMAYKIVPYLTASAMFSGLFMLLSVGLTLTYKNKMASLATIIAAALNVVLNLALIPKYMIAGAALASIISTLVMVILQYLFAQAQYRISYNMKLLGACVIICTFVSVFILNFTPSVLLRMIILLISVSAILMIGRFKIQTLRYHLKR